MAMCGWLGNLRDVIECFRSLTSILLMETNGDSAQLSDQIDHVQSFYTEVEQEASRSCDDYLKWHCQCFNCNGG